MDKNLDAATHPQARRPLRRVSSSWAGRRVSADRALVRQELAGTDWLAAVRLLAEPGSPDRLQAPEDPLADPSSSTA